MPDWFYRTVSQPALFRLPAERARDLALGFMGRLGRLQFGPALIDFLGHMRPDARLSASFLGIDFPTRVGLGPGLDTKAIALPALARFGFGFIEVGPVTLEETKGERPLRRLADREAIWSPDPPTTLSLSDGVARLKEVAGRGLPLMVRIGASGEEAQRLARELAPHVQAFVLQRVEDLRGIVEAVQRPVLLRVPVDVDLDKAAPNIDAALAAGASGLLVDGSLADEGGQIIGLPARGRTLELVRGIRQRWGSSLFLIASGGIHEPADACGLRCAGADLVQVDSGLVFTGPGLPKRINDAFLFDTVGPAPIPARATELTWFWTALMGAAMLVGSLIAVVVAATRVVLPYDEVFAGMMREQLCSVNPRLLAFMAHDRVSLAGTMVSIGIMYLGLSVFGIRRGLHWAQQALFISAFTGFASFFLFLGFGYLDTFHAFVTAVLVQFLLMAMHCRLGTHVPEGPPDLRGDSAWRRGLWGQFLMILHGTALLGAGATICTIGVTSVFVPEDLDFMQTTAAALDASNPRLVPLVAHDRATFGGMLLAGGWAFLLPALWGFRRGAAWLWWTFLVAGLSSYTVAIGVHFVVGYVNWFHLLPAFSGLGLFLLGLGLSHAWLCRSVSALKVSSGSPERPS